jgi:hypothetical protein
MSYPADKVRVVAKSREVMEFVSTPSAAFRGTSPVEGEGPAGRPGVGWILLKGRNP